MNRTHGGYGTPEYLAWIEMRRRCYSPNVQSYKNYGGRGIKVCARWKSSFVNFRADMGPRPANFSLERKNNNRGYTPKNCLWIPLRNQSDNRRNVKVRRSRWHEVATFYSIHSLQATAKHFNVCKTTVQNIIAKHKAL